jgi:hypothetical protein
MSENPKINASETPVAKSEELAPSELEKSMEALRALQPKSHRNRRRLRSKTTASTFNRF